MEHAMPVIKEVTLLLEQFPHVQDTQSVHEAVGLLFSRIDPATGSLLYDELLVINGQSQYVGRLTLRNILTCYFPTLFTESKRDVFAGK